MGNQKPTTTSPAVVKTYASKMIKRFKRSATREALVEEVVAPLDKPRHLRAGVFTRFRKSDNQDTKKTGSFWKHRRDPVPTQGVVLFKSKNDDHLVVTAQTSQTNSNIFRASSIATAEVTIPTDGSMGATTNADSSSSCLHEGDASFFQATETLIEIKDVLIPTADGQIETQRQECIVSDMHRLDEEASYDDDETSESQRPFDFVLDMPVDEPSKSSKVEPFDFHFASAEIELSSVVVAEADENEDGDTQSADSQTSASSYSSNDSSEKEEEEADAVFQDFLSVPSDEEKEAIVPEENDIFSDFEEEEESLPHAEKGVAFLQSLFLSDLPDDDDESSSPYESDLESEPSRTPFGSALDALEDFAAESIYSASLLFMGPAELDERRFLKKQKSKKVMSS
jgi:hypothetical protein